MIHCVVEMSALWLAWLHDSKNSSSGKSPIAGPSQHIPANCCTAVLLIHFIFYFLKSQLSASLGVFRVCMWGVLDAFHNSRAI
jgi:hypothetical protein